MAVRESWYLAITWRKSSFTGNDSDCVEVACYEASPASCAEELASASRPQEHG